MCKRNHDLDLRNRVPRGCKRGTNNCNPSAFHTNLSSSMFCNFDLYFYCHKFYSFVSSFLSILFLSLNLFIFLLFKKEFKKLVRLTFTFEIELNYYPTDEVCTRCRTLFICRKHPEEVLPRTCCISQFLIVHFVFLYHLGHVKYAFSILNEVEICMFLFYFCFVNYQFVTCDLICLSYCSILHHLNLFIFPVYCEIQHLSFSCNSLKLEIFNVGQNVFNFHNVFILLIFPLNSCFW